MNTENTLCPRLTHPLVIEKIAIDAKEQYSLSESYEEISFHNIEYGLERFIAGLDNIHFHDYIGHLYLNGNVLLYYPTLAKKVHALELNDYPFLERNYKVDTAIKGVAPFLKYFSQYTIKCFLQFRADLTQISYIVNSLIALHGNERCIPIIDDAVSCDNQKYLVVHGIRWRLAKDYDNAQKTESINLSNLLKLRDLIGRSYEDGSVTFEDATPGTPFIAVRIQKTWRHKGRVIWYDLNTRKQVSKVDRVKWKHPLSEKTGDKLMYNTFNSIHDVPYSSSNA